MTNPEANPKTAPIVTGEGLFGSLLLVCGVLMVWYYFMAFDTSTVSDSTSVLGGLVVDPTRLHNFGLLTDKLCGVLIGCSLCITGAIVAKR